MDIFFKLVIEVGFPIASSMAAGYFVFLTLKFILASVTSSVKSMASVIVRLDGRVKSMNNDVVKIDLLVSNALGLKPDIDRIARIESRNMKRKD
jgi:hypothetical protein